MLYLVPCIPSIEFSVLFSRPRGQGSPQPQPPFQLPELSDGRGFAKASLFANRRSGAKKTIAQEAPVQGLKPKNLFTFSMF